MCLQAPGAVGLTIAMRTDETDPREGWEAVLPTHSSGPAGGFLELGHRRRKVQRAQVRVHLPEPWQTQASLLEPGR